MNIPSEVRRWDDILPGVAAIIKHSFHLLQSRDNEIGWGKVALSQKHRCMLPPTCDDFQDDDTLRKLTSPLV